MGKQPSRAGARVITSRPPPPDLRQRFLNILGLKINHEHDKWFVRLSTI